MSGGREHLREEGLRSGPLRGQLAWVAVGLSHLAGGPHRAPTAWGAAGGMQPQEHGARSRAISCPAALISMPHSKGWREGAWDATATVSMVSRLWKLRDGWLREMDG